MTYYIPSGTLNFTNSLTHTQADTEDIYEYTFSHKDIQRVTKKHCLLMLRISGFSTEGEMDNVRLVGPRPPATYLFIPGTLITVQ